ncbi:MAG: HPr(Ser) kinase/phosphatase [Erysipelotrichaceae bacterium]|nr:HPr(Ser) kinase/phosphatase [Erysipelotrichaceae bacterium]
MKAEVKMLEEKFHWPLVAGNEESLHRPITLPDINRPGLELTGYFTDSQRKRIIVIGGKEHRYIMDNMDEISQRRVFEFLTSDKTPCIIVTNDYECPPLLQEIASRKNFPVFTTDQRTSTVMVNVTNYLDEVLAPSQIIHAELVSIYGVGVLITGASGMGKSEIVLDLVKKGHQLVADDRVDIYRVHNSLVGRTAQLIEGYMELRGVGIIDVKRMFGITSVTPSAPVDLEIVLEKYKDNMDYDRLGLEEKTYSDYLGIQILRMVIPVTYGRPMSTIIETAVTNFLLLREGFDSSREFEERVLEEIARNRNFDVK